MKLADLRAHLTLPELQRLNDAELESLWARFSEIQCASSLIYSRESAERFELWRRTGNDEDAWS